MDRARRVGTPALSKLTVKARPLGRSGEALLKGSASRPKKNRRRQTLWSRLPKPAVVADSCGRALRRSLPALAAAGSLAAVGTGAVVGYHWVTRSPRFAITAIEIRGTQHLSAAALLATLPVHTGENIFRTNLGVLEAALATEPWIASVSAQRELPHTLVLEIHERTAVAVAQVGPDAYLLDGAGHPFKRASGAEADGLPVVAGLERAAFARDPAGTALTVTVALAALATWDASPARPHAAAVDIDALGSLVVHPALGATRVASVDLGPLGGDLAPRLAAFDAAWSELSPDERADLRTIHLGARPDHVTVAFATTVAPTAAATKN